MLFPAVLATALLASTLTTTPTAVASWEMNDPAGSTSMADSSPSHLTGALKGGVSATGSTFSFSGSGVVTVSSSSSLDLGARPFTMETRLRFTKVPSAAVGDYDILRGTPGGGWRLEIVARKNRTQAVAACGYSGSKGKILLTGGPHLADGAWHVAKCVKTDSSVSLLVDGKTVAQRAISIGSVGNKAPLAVGAKPNGEDPFTGELDYVRIWLD